MKLNHRAGLGRWLAVGIALIAQPALAQLDSNIENAPPGQVDPADRLAANLVILSQNPRDVRALTEAGLSAIAVGDGNAALSFLARADELSPNTGRIKAALGSALLLVEKPTDALRLFGEAVSLGVSEQSIARDRGLAYDLRGDPKRAQRDYATALRVGGPDDDLTIRYALSLGISGEREHALDVLDPVLRKQNLSAWRARAFILAMNGDEEKAEDLARQIMPGGSGASMAPFLRRLATLNAAERALAVNFGIMPSDGQRYAQVETGDPYRPGGASSDGLIPAGDALGPRPSDVEDQPKKAQPVSKEPRRRPGRETVTLTAAREPEATPGMGGDEFDTPVKAAKNVKTLPVQTAANLPGDGRVGQRVGQRIGPVDPSRLPPEVREALKPGASVAKPGTAPSAQGSRVTLTNATSLPPPNGEPPAATVRREPQAPPPSSDDTPAPRFEIDAAPRPVQTAAVQPQPVHAPMSTPISSQLQSVEMPAPSEPRQAPPTAAQPVVPQPTPAANIPPQPSVAASLGLGGLLQGLQVEQESAAGPLPTAAQMKAARVAAQKKAAADAKAEAAAKAEKAAKDAERQAAARNPARIWVQVATGSNEAGLPSTWKKLKDKSPTTFKGLNASSVPFKATNRLLVGPFKNQAEARALVNAMNKAGMSGSTFTSEAGQEIAKVSAK